MSDTEGTTPALSSATPRRSTCPAWCDDHDGFDDASGDWHKSRDRVLGDHEIYISTGTASGDVEVFMEWGEGVPLDTAEAWAKLILELVGAARSTSGPAAAR